MSSAESGHQVALAEAQVARSRSQPGRTEEIVSRTVIRAPITRAGGATSCSESAVQVNRARSCLPVG
ncbi:MAG: hypothetical protein U5J63_14430 [Fodinibius sp.]|nr:hypothetical protein [Fodinibius sp.]